MKKIGVVMAAIFVGGCAVSKEINLPDGSNGYKISCNGAALNYGDCLEKAGQICGTRGYSVITSNGDAVPFSTNTGSAYVNRTAGSANIFGSSGMMMSRNIFVKCRE